jgi:hypothetical protein
MWSERDNHGFGNEEDYLKSMKKADTYRFTYPFEYIAVNHGEDNYDIGTAFMEVSVDWSPAQSGYVISYSVPNMHDIQASEGNSDADGFYEYGVESRLMDDLKNLGIGVELISS